MKNLIQIERFYMLDKSLQLIEGTIVAAFWAHLVDTYNYFAKEDASFDNTIYQSSKVIQAFTSIGQKAQDKAKVRLKELGFIDYMVATKPGEATKVTVYLLNQQGYYEWYKKHEFDELRRDQYEKLQNHKDRKRLDEWKKKSMKKLGIQEGSNNGEKQKSKKQFAKKPKDSLQDDLKPISNDLKENVIENKEIESNIDNKIIEDTDVVYSDEKYAYLKGKSKKDIALLIVESYSSGIKSHRYHLEQGYSDDRYIGDLNKIETKILSLDVAIAVSYYIGILGYLDGLRSKFFSNQKAYQTSYKLENLIYFNVGIISSLENMQQGARTYRSKHEPKIEEINLPPEKCL